jgi:hypothetical protein
MDKRSTETVQVMREIGKVFVLITARVKEKLIALPFYWLSREKLPV